MSEGTVASRWNLDAIEDAHRRWKQDPSSVDESWRYFFEGFELGAVRPSASGVDAARLQTGVVRLIYAYREIGHFLAHLDPLNDPRPSYPLLELVRIRPVRSRHGPRFRHQPVRRPAARSLRDLLKALRETYCRTIGVEYMHIQDTAHPPLAARAHGAAPQPAQLRPRPEDAHPQEPPLRRAVRALPPHPLHRPETLLAGRRRDAHPDAGGDRREGAGLPDPRDHPRHVAPRPAQRAGQHPAQALRGDFRPVRGELSAGVDGRRRRREVPPRLLQRPRQLARPASPRVAGAEPQPPGGRRSGRRGPHAGQADALRRQGSQKGHSRAGPRRRRLRRPGAGRRDAQPVAARRLHDRRHASTSSSTTRSASPPRRSTPARRPTAPTSAR